MRRNLIPSANILKYYLTFLKNQAVFTHSLQKQHAGILFRSFKPFRIKKNAETKDTSSGSRNHSGI
ncbi:MAG: hypothetical protein BWK80_46330 [Desulfobacteraceae bacterium IS3]|nr:MAG: hypothetical protein BWK80_46330 [Desulfobacteraceae bacterium IS3]